MRPCWPWPPDTRAGRARTPWSKAYFRTHPADLGWKALAVNLSGSRRPWAPRPPGPPRLTPPISAMPPGQAFAAGFVRWRNARGSARWRRLYHAARAVGHGHGRTGSFGVARRRAPGRSATWCSSRLSRRCGCGGLPASCSGYLREAGLFAAPAAPARGAGRAPAGPAPRVAQGWPARPLPMPCIDVSDGFVVDWHHVWCRQRRRKPRSTPRAARLLGPDHPVQNRARAPRPAVGWGDDHELCFCGRCGRGRGDRHVGASGGGVTAIGALSPAVPGACTMLANIPWRPAQWLNHQLMALDVAQRCALLRDPAGSRQRFCSGLSPASHRHGWFAAARCCPLMLRELFLSLVLALIAARILYWAVLAADRVAARPRQLIPAASSAGRICRPVLAPLSRGCFGRGQLAAAVDGRRRQLFCASRRALQAPAQCPGPTRSVNGRRRAMLDDLPRGRRWPLLLAWLVAPAPAHSAGRPRKSRRTGQGRHASSARKCPAAAGRTRIGPRESGRDAPLQPSGPPLVDHAGCRVRPRSLHRRLVGWHPSDSANQGCAGTSSDAARDCGGQGRQRGSRSRGRRASVSGGGRSPRGRP